MTTPDNEADLRQQINAMAAGRLLLGQGEVCKALGIGPDRLKSEIEDRRLPFFPAW